MQKRKQIIVNPQVQFRTLSLLSFFGVLPLLGIFFGGFSYTNHLIQNSPTVELLQAPVMEIFQKVFALVFGGFFMILFLLAFALTRQLFKVVGPIYRVEMDMKEMLMSKQFQKTVRIRKEDELHSFVDTVNRFVASKVS